MCIRSQNLKALKMYWAADSEFKPLMDNQTWDLVKVLSNRQLIGSKWMFKVKHDGGTFQSQTGCKGLCTNTWC